MVAKWTVWTHLSRSNRSLQHHLTATWHLQINRFAGGETYSFPCINSCKQPFTELHWNWCCCRHHKQRVHTNGDGDLKLFTHRRCLAQVTRTTTNAQPMHGHGVDRLTLQPINPHVWNTGFRVLRDHESQRDHTTGITRPRSDQGDLFQIDVISQKHLLPAGRDKIAVWSGLHQIPKHPCKLLGLLEVFRRPRLLKDGKSGSKLLELFSPFQTHAPNHTLHSAERVDGYRHAGANHVLKQQGWSTSSKNPISNGC